MEKIGDIEIRVIGKSGNQNLSPDNYDIKHIATILQNVEDLLYPNNKKNTPIITYDIEEGSVLTPIKQEYYSLFQKLIKRFVFSLKSGVGPGSIFPLV